MDGPYTNWSMIDLLKKDIQMSEDDPLFIDTGSCGLHVVHGSFQYAFRKTGWETDVFLKSSHNVFKDSPARRADFKIETKTSDFPLKFATCRWLENSPTCERVIKILPHLKTYLKKKGDDLPNTFSVRKLIEILQDPLLLPKLHFFLTIALAFESFLPEFQTSKRMFPFLHSSVELVRQLMKRLIKPTVLENATSAFKLVNIDIEDVANGLKLKSVKIGPAAEHALTTLTVKDVVKEKFRLEAKNCLVRIVKKLVERSPLKYKFVYAASCLDPKNIYTRPEQSKTKFGTCVSMLLANNHVTSLEADRAIMQFGRFVQRIDREEFRKFDRHTSRLGTFYAKLMSDQEEYKDAWNICKIILIFSHGNAFVEGGFSINKDMVVENLLEESLIALRRCYDGILYLGGVDAIEVDREMVKYARGAYARQQNTLEERRKKVEERERAYMTEEKKRKAEKLLQLEKEKQELESKKSKLEREIKKLKKSRSEEMEKTFFCRHRVRGKCDLGGI